MSNPQREPVFLKIVITPDVYSKVEAFKEGWKKTDPDLKANDVVVRVDTFEGKAFEQEYTMTEFLELLGFEDALELIKPCEQCGGINEHLEVATDESDGEGHVMRGVGSARCPNAPERDNDPGDE